MPGTIEAVQTAPPPGSVEPSRDREAALALIRGEHAELSGLCDMLEEAANRLPVLPRDSQRANLCQRLRRVESGRPLREEALSSAIGASAAGAPAAAGEVREAMAHVHDCQLTDALHAEDLAAALDDAGDELCGESSRALAYMLRCFFDGCRRAVAFETLVLTRFGESDTDSKGAPDGPAVA